MKGNTMLHQSSKKVKQAAHRDLHSIDPDKVHVRSGGESHTIGHFRQALQRGGISALLSEMHRLKLSAGAMRAVFKGLEGGAA